MPSATTPPSTTHPDIPPFPPPSTFFILPDIYLLITRLDLLQQSQSQSQLEAQPGPPSLQPTTPGDTSLPAISTKDLPTLTHPIKQKIAKARAAVQALPDVERSVAEQEDEIQMLEARVVALKRRLVELGIIAGRGGDGEVVKEGKREQGDVIMSGVEG